MIDPRTIQNLDNEETNYIRSFEAWYNALSNRDDLLVAALKDECLLPLLQRIPSGTSKRKRCSYYRGLDKLLRDVLL